MNDDDIEDWFSAQHAVVTGGGSGIGAAVAEALAQAGARVTLVGRNRQRLEEKAAEFDVSYQVADVTRRKDIEGAFDLATKTNGAITILVNNAGAAVATSFTKMEDALWHQMLAVNLTGVYYCTQVVSSAMLAAGSGRVVNIASTAGLTGYAYVAAYCAAKHGVVGLTRSLAREFARQGVTVNAVCPGYTNTEMVELAVDRIVANTDRTRDQALAELVKRNPQQRLVEPAEVAATVLWLCQKDSQAINGQAIAVAGSEVM